MASRCDFHTKHILCLHFQQEKLIGQGDKEEAVKDLRMETRATTADRRLKHESLMNSNQEEMVISIT